MSRLFQVDSVCGLPSRARAIAAGTGCYAVGLVVWIMALSRTKVSIAYPMLSVGFALNALLAWWLLGEAVSAQRLAGIAVIMLGVWLVARS